MRAFIGVSQKCPHDIETFGYDIGSDLSQRDPLLPHFKSGCYSAVALRTPE
jgi:hypothetical protein